MNRGVKTASIGLIYTNELIHTYSVYASLSEDPLSKTSQKMLTLLASPPGCYLTVYS